MKNKELLELMAHYLEARNDAIKDQFTLGIWWRQEGVGDAIGHFYHDMRELEEAGFKLIPDGVGRCRPMYEGSYDYYAVADFFGISEKEALDLFAPMAYGPAVQPVHVAKRLREFIAQHS